MPRLHPYGQGKIEVWLTQGNMEMVCRVVRQNESTETPSVDSLTVRGAMREITGDLLKQGYEPVGRWQDGDDSGTDVPEVFRVFKPIVQQP